MTTSVLFYRKDSNGKSIYNSSEKRRDCCQYIKSNSYSGYYQEIFVYHPVNNRHAIDKHSQRIIDAINFFFGGWFTINLVTDKKELLRFKKHTGTAGYTFGFHIILHNKGVTKGRKQFNQLLFPLTLSRWALAGSEYRTARAKFVDILDSYPLDSIYVPALVQTIDLFHNYYPVTTRLSPIFYDKETFFDSLGKTNTSTIPSVTEVMGMGFKGIKSSLPTGGQYPYANISAQITGLYSMQTIRIAILGQVTGSSANSVDAIGLYNQLAETLYGVNEIVKAIIVRHKDIKPNGSYNKQYMELYRDLAQLQSNQI